MEVQKVCLKIPVLGKIDSKAVQKAFMVWIQKNKLPGILIDVADYGHMHQGPGTVLMAHEFIFSLDEQDGINGIRVSSRLTSDKPLASRINENLDLLKKGGQLLHEELGLQIDGTRIEICVLDRLNSDANTPKILQETLALLLPGHRLQKQDAAREARRLPGIDLVVSPALTLT